MKSVDVVGWKTYYMFMETLVAEIIAYAASRGIKPATVLQYGANLSGSTWNKWIEGRASCTFQVAEKLRIYMRDNPASLKEGAA